MANKPVLLIPGLNATPRVFAPVLDTLWQAGPVAVADTKLGNTVAAMAAAILEAAPPTFVLGGFSMGGYVAFEIMRQAPGRVTGLLLIDTSARPDTPDATEKRRGGIDLAKAGKLQLAAAQTFPNAVHPSNKENAELKAIHLAMAAAVGADAYIRQQEAIISRPDSRPDLANIKVPTLVIVGDGDAITPPEVAREMAAGIAGAKLTVIERAGHLALLEQPEQVSAALAGWLK
jgi:pimeloyl-ACP methyl ester carboxylesterase